MYLSKQALLFRTILFHSRWHYHLIVTFFSRGLITYLYYVKYSTNLPTFPIICFLEAQLSPCTYLHTASANAHPASPFLSETLQQSLSKHPAVVVTQMVHPLPNCHRPHSPLGLNRTNACRTCTLISFLNSSNLSILPFPLLFLSSSKLCWTFQCSLSSIHPISPFPFAVLQTLVLWPPNFQTRPPARYADLIFTSIFCNSRFCTTVIFFSFFLPTTILQVVLFQLNNVPYPSMSIAVSRYACCVVLHVSGSDWLKSPRRTRFLQSVLTTSSPLPSAQFISFYSLCSVSVRAIISSME